MGSQVAPVEKQLPAKAGDARDASSIRGLGRSSGGRNGNPLQSSGIIPWTEEPGRLYSPWGQKELDMAE